MKASSLDPIWIDKYRRDVECTDPRYLDHAGDVKAILQLRPIADYGAEDCDKFGVVTDVETTGTDVRSDKITEFCFLPFRFNAKGGVGEVMDPITMLNDPGIPIPKLVTNLTGITDDMVRGIHANPNTVYSIIKRADLMIAHNARFDRQMEEAFLKEHDLEALKPWICTASDVDWRSYGITSPKLDYLAFKFGFYFEHHRGETDCRATLHILASKLPSGNTVLGEAFSRGLAPRARLWASGSPFETKDTLKMRGYRWDTNRKTWWKELPLADVDAEKEWLQHEVYKQGGAPDLEPIRITERFREA